MPYDKQFIREVTSNMKRSTRHYFELIVILNARIERQFDCVHDYAKPCDPKVPPTPMVRAYAQNVGWKTVTRFTCRRTLIKMSSGPSLCQGIRGLMGCIYKVELIVNGNKPKSAFIEAFWCEWYRYFPSRWRADSKKAEAYAYSQYRNAWLARAPVDVILMVGIAQMVMLNARNVDCKEKHWCLRPCVLYVKRPLTIPRWVSMPQTLWISPPWSVLKSWLMKRYTVVAHSSGKQKQWYWHYFGRNLKGQYS